MSSYQDKPGGEERRGAKAPGLSLDPGVFGSVFDRQARPVAPAAPPQPAPMSPAETAASASPFHFSLFARDPLTRHLEAEGKPALPDVGGEAAEVIQRRPPPPPPPMIVQVTSAEAPVAPALEPPAQKWEPLLPAPPPPPRAWVAREVMKPVTQDYQPLASGSDPVAIEPRPLPVVSRPLRPTPAPPPVVPAALAAEPEDELETGFDDESEDELSEDFEEEFEDEPPPVPRRQLRWKADQEIRHKRLPLRWLLALAVVAAAAGSLWWGLGKIAPRRAANPAVAVTGVVAYPLVTITAPVGGKVDALGSVGTMMASGDPIMTLVLPSGQAQVAATDQQSQLADDDRQIAALESQRDGLMTKAPDQFYRFELAGLSGQLQDLQNQRDALAAQIPAPSQYAPASNSALRQPVTAGKASRLVRLLVPQGANVVAGAGLAEVGDCTALYVSVPMAQLARAGLYGGDLVQVTLAGGDGVVSGQIERDGPGGDDSNANAKIDLFISSIEGAWAECPVDSPVAIAPQSVT